MPDETSEPVAVDLRVPLELIVELAEARIRKSRVVAMRWAVSTLIAAAALPSWLLWDARTTLETAVAGQIDDQIDELETAVDDQIQERVRRVAGDRVGYILSVD